MRSPSREDVRHHRSTDCTNEWCRSSSHKADARRAEPCMLVLPFRWPPALAQKPGGGTLTIDPAEMQKPWTGDLDGDDRAAGHSRADRHTARPSISSTRACCAAPSSMSSSCSKTELNKKLAAEKKLKHKNLKVRVVFIPVRRDQLLPALAAGKGDIAAANLTITPERQKLVDFTAARMSNVSEVVVTGPASPKIASLDDLAGKEVFVRKSSSYYESLVALNKKFAAEKKAAGHAQGSPRDAGGRGSARDAQRRPRRARRRRQAQGGLLEADLPEAHRARQASRFAPAARSRGRFARAARSSRRRWTISSRATRSGPRPATNC